MRTLTVAALAVAALTNTPTLAATPTAPADFDGNHAYSFAELAADASRLPAWDNPAPHDWQTTSPTGGTGRTGWFGKAWSLDLDGNGCDARQDTLARDLTEHQNFPNDPCKVASGYLTDVYTGAEVRFVHSNAPATTVDGVLTQPDSQTLQIDHMIPLSAAWAHGAWAWTQDQRLTFANDPLVLVTADGDANNAKDDSLVATSPTGQTSRGTYQVDAGPGWQPAPAYRCSYDARTVLIALKYRLGLDSDDATVLHDELTDCATTAPAATFTPDILQSEPVSKTLAGTTSTTAAVEEPTASTTPHAGHAASRTHLSPRALAGVVGVVLVALLGRGRRRRR